MWMPPVPKPKRERRRHFLKEWRVYRGYKQELAAEMAGMTRENLSKIERGLVPYTQDTLETLAEAYMCEPQDLIMRDPTRPDAPCLSMTNCSAPPRLHDAKSRPLSRRF